MRKHRRVGLLTCSAVTVLGLGAIALMPGDGSAQAPAASPYSVGASANASSAATTPSASTPAGSRIRFPSSTDAAKPQTNNPYAPPSDRYAQNPIRQTAAEAPLPAASTTTAPLTAAAPPPSNNLPPTSAAPATASLPRYSPPQTLPAQAAPPQPLPVGAGLGTSLPPTTAASPAATQPSATQSTAPSTISPYPPAPNSGYRPNGVAPTAPAPTTAAPSTTPIGPTPTNPAPTTVYAPPTTSYNPPVARPSGAVLEGTGRPGEKALEGAQQPTLVIEKLSPPEIQVGKPALFELHVRNVGQTVANDVQVRDLVPQGTSLTKTTPPAQQIPPSGTVQWTIGTLRPGDEAVLSMELMPLTEGEIGSVATVHYSAAVSGRTICTKPELVVDVQAPRSVQAGDDVPLRIRVSNPGSGVATGVLLTEVVPANMTHDGGAELEYEVGDLQPGQSRELELMLRAVKPGQAMNQLHAKGEGKLATEAKTPIEVVAPALSLAVEGPKRRYLDRQATYTVSIANPGTASARDVELATYLPRGLQFVDANNNGEYDATTHSVRWLLEELPPRERGSVQLTTLPVEPGQQLLRIESTAERGVQAQKEEAILVEGAASVAFQVVDTADPIEVGGETTYEIVVSNQGSKEAANIQLAATLPEGLKPLDAEGPTRFTVNGRQVQFQPLAQLPPKGETVYRIRVQCTAAGDHRCHVQLLSDDMRTPVTKEEGTRVYADE